MSRAILVTGGSRGIGAAIVRAFAARGDRVAVHYRDAAEAATAVRDGLPGKGHVVVRADLADADAVRAMVDDAAARLGGLDVLVNNAGIYVGHPVLGTSYEEWQNAWHATLGVNLTGAANATWCAVRHMAARGGGRIVNVGSRGAYRGEPDHPAYGASKAGLHAFGQSLAVALAPHGIAVASVAPGYVQTDMTEEELGAPAGDLIRAQSPFNRVALPEEIAAAVVYLASPEACWASGAVLDLNGASYLRLARPALGEEDEPAGDRLSADLRPWPGRCPVRGRSGSIGAMDYVLAQVNVGRLVAPLDSPRLAGFVAALDPVNAVADAAPGFVWRLQTEDGNATAIRAFERDAEGADGGILINMSVWESVGALGAYVYGAAHVAVLRQRREWFERMKDAYTALWWIPRGHIPAVREAEDRVRHLRAHGPTPYAFTLREHFPPPDSGDTSLLRSPEDWTCPA